MRKWKKQQYKFDECAALVAATVEKALIELSNFSDQYSACAESPAEYIASMERLSRKNAKSLAERLAALKPLASDGRRLAEYAGKLELSITATIYDTVQLMAASQEVKMLKDYIEMSEATKE